MIQQAQFSVLSRIEEILAPSCSLQPYLQWLGGRNNLNVYLLINGLFKKVCHIYKIDYYLA